MKILMPLPPTDFDPTETAIPWKVISEAGHEVVFATPDGKAGRADPLMVTGENLGPVKHILMARRDARDAYEAMRESEAFQKPLTWAGLGGLSFGEDVDGLVLAGGHAPGMKVYLESEAVQRVVVDAMKASAPVGAICHGVVVMARSVDPDTGRSVLHGRKTSALLEDQEMAAWWMTRAWLKDYYRTYPQTVQAEVTAALAGPEDFVSGPRPLLRDTPARPGFVVRDGNYVSARWPGDAWGFSGAFVEVLGARHMLW